MVSRWGRKRAARKVVPGDGHALPRFRWWQPLSRTLFHIALDDSDGSRHVWSVDVRLWGDSDGNVSARLYRDGVHVAGSTLPAAFPVPGGAIEVMASSFGLKRCHFVPDAAGARAAAQLAPDPASAEGRRARLDARHPRASRALGVASFAVLVVALVLGLPQIAEQITRIPVVADAVGVFVSPIHLPEWANISLLVATLAASTERALRLRYSWLLDGGVLDGEI